MAPEDLRQQSASQDPTSTADIARPNQREHSMHFTTSGPLNYLETHIRLRLAKARDLSQEGERGASAIEWVIISALLIGIVLAVGGIILSKLTAKATSLNLG
jgi:Flp pilus assembly pilin Flp